ncbi:MAG: glutamate synthase [Chloroflexi bacterium]|nr:glutamate synthase [Chloroflexota bacterium]|tara:strand:- start:6285 stop:7748 length:1464 start_codon:yes stop_codon:yes gene_type:complete
MGKLTGFKEFNRKNFKRRSVSERIQDWKEIYFPWNENEAKEQASRCMDCGVPFCNNGCPLGNLIPDWNDLVYSGDWKRAIDQLHATNNFPEFTGRICPAPCEAACTLSINDDPVTIEYIEKTIVERAFSEGWIKPEPPNVRTDKRIAVVGSGPAGLAAAQQLNRAGHKVTVFERDSRIGGLLTFGIPDFKLEKEIVERRVNILKEEGINFKVNVNVGKDYSSEDLVNNFDAVCLAGGSTIPRNLDIEGRNLDGIHYAMEYLKQQNDLNQNNKLKISNRIQATDKNVVILGGGDTGADCLGTAHRQGALSITQLELMESPPENRSINNPWPEWPLIMRTSSAHEEGGNREYSVLTKKLTGSNGKVKELHAVKIKFEKDKSGNINLIEAPNSNFTIKADLVLLAMGFLHPQKEGLIDNLKVTLDNKGNVLTGNNMMSSKEKIFACGDMHHGQSLVVRAIASGRDCARNIDIWLMGTSNLPKVRGFARSN